MPFLRRPRPGANEIFSSYLLRLTQENGYSNYQAILDYVSIQSDLHKLNYLPKDTTNLTRLSQMTEVEEGHLWEMVFSEMGDRKVKAYRSVLDYEWLEREKIKICPTCFATDGYYHKHWSLWCYTSCYIHQCLLVDTCPQCQSVWNWDELKNDWKCKCGWQFGETLVTKIKQEENDLSEVVARSCKLTEGKSTSLSSKSPLSDLSLSQISLLMISTALSLHNPGDSLYRLQLPLTNRKLHKLLSKSAQIYETGSLGKLRKAELQLIGDCHPILNLELEHLISLFSFFAGQLIDVGDTTGKFIATNRSNVELHELFLSARDYLQEFPHGFERFLEWYKNKSSHPERDTGIARDFGNFYRRLYKNFPRHTFGFLHKAFENYLATKWDGGYLNSKLGRIEIPDDSDRKFLSGVETAKLLKMKEAWVLRSVECGILKGRLRKMGKRTSVLVERESAEAYLQNLKNAISPKDIAKILGIGRKAVVDLIEHSCLTAFRGRTVDGHQKWLINRNAPVELLNHIDTLLNETINNEITDKCSFDLAIRRLSGSGCTIGSLVEAILDKTIVPISKDKGIGLKQYCFDVRDVNRLVEEYFKGDEEILTVLDVAILLGVKQQVAAFWIDHGFIEAEIEIHQHHRHRKVLKSSIAKFHTQYVTAVALACQIHTSPRKVISLLNEKNVFPISGKQVDGGRQYLFLKQQVVACFY